MRDPRVATRLSCEVGLMAGRLANFLGEGDAGRGALTASCKQAEPAALEALRGSVMDALMERLAGEEICAAALDLDPGYVDWPGVLMRSCMCDLRAASRLSREVGLMAGRLANFLDEGGAGRGFLTACLVERLAGEELTLGYRDWLGVMRFVYA